MNKNVWRNVSSWTYYNTYPVIMIGYNNKINVTELCIEDVNKKQICVKI